MEPWIVLLLMAGGIALIGVAALVYALRRRRYEAGDETQVLRDKLNDAARQIEFQQKTIRELSHEARTDSLTQLPNRAALEGELIRRGAEVIRYDLPMCLLMIDLGNFQQIVEENGIVFGDVMLQHVAEIVRSQIRVCDFAARIGTDVFGVVLGHTTPENAANVGRRLKKAVEGVEFLDDQGGTVEVQVSVGVTPLSGSADETLRRCERALAQAKSEGKNRVVIGELEQDIVSV